MRLRTQREALEELRAIDPGCALSAWALRSMILSGRVATIQVGRKRLIDLDRLPEYLAAPAPASQHVSPAGGDRRMDT